MKIVGKCLRKFRKDECCFEEWNAYLELNMRSGDLGNGGLGWENWEWDLIIKRTSTIFISCVVLSDTKINAQQKSQITQVTSKAY